MNRKKYLTALWKTFISVRIAIKVRYRYLDNKMKTKWCPKQVQVCSLCKMGGHNMGHKTIGGDREADHQNLSEISELESFLGWSGNSKAYAKYNIIQSIQSKVQTTKTLLTRILFQRYKLKCNISCDQCLLIPDPQVDWSPGAGHRLLNCRHWGSGQGVISHFLEQRSRCC